MNRNSNSDEKVNVGRYVGGALLAALFFKLPIVRALPCLILGMAVALVRPVLLVLGLVKAVEVFPRLLSQSDTHQTHNP